MVGEKYVMRRFFKQLTEKLRDFADWLIATLALIILPLIAAILPGDDSDLEGDADP